MFYFTKPAKLQNIESSTILPKCISRTSYWSVVQVSDKLVQNIQQLYCNGHNLHSIYHHFQFFTYFLKSSLFRFLWKDKSHKNKQIPVSTLNAVVTWSTSDNRDKTNFKITRWVKGSIDFRCRKSTYSISR